MGNEMFIITSDHAGIPDIVDDGVNGIVINCLEDYGHEGFEIVF